MLVMNPIKVTLGTLEDQILKNNIPHNEFQFTEQSRKKGSF